MSIPVRAWMCVGLTTSIRHERAAVASTILALASGQMLSVTSPDFLPVPDVSASSRPSLRRGGGSVRRAGPRGGLRPSDAPARHSVRTSSKLAAAASAQRRGLYAAPELTVPRGSADALAEIVLGWLAGHLMAGLGGAARDDEVLRAGRLPAVGGDRVEGERARARRCPRPCRSCGSARSGRGRAIRSCRPACARPSRTCCSRPRRRWRPLPCPSGSGSPAGRRRWRRRPAWHRWP